MPENPPSFINPIRVKATAEGMEHQLTSTGYYIDRAVSFVALPSDRALHKFVRVTNPLNGKSTYAQVLDDGPWDENDDAYVFGGARPKAESGLDQFGRKTNGSGIDLGFRVWADLGMTDNTEVEWYFLAGQNL